MLLYIIYILSVIYSLLVSQCALVLIYMLYSLFTSSSESSSEASMFIITLLSSVYTDESASTCSVCICYTLHVSVVTHKSHNHFSLYTWLSESSSESLRITVVCPGDFITVSGISTCIQYTFYVKKVYMIVKLQLCSTVITIDCPKTLIKLWFFIMIELQFHYIWITINNNNKEKYITLWCNYMITLRYVTCAAKRYPNWFSLKSSFVTINRVPWRMFPISHVSLPYVI